MRIFIICLVISICFTGGLTAQDVQPPLFDLQNEKYNVSLEKFYQNRSIIHTAVSQVLETELEASAYLVGPGDLFKLNIFGEIENEYQFEVLPEGSVLIPTVGSVSVDSLTLKEAKERILDRASEFYPKGKIQINLVGLRKFRVYLTGEVYNPGTYFVQGTDRVSDVIEVSAGYQPAPTSPQEERVANPGLTDWANDTRIEIRHINGITDTVDLTKFYQAGDIGNNPTLRGGDVIFVPSIDLLSKHVIVEGNVGRQGIYSLKEGETIFAFLRRVAAISKRSELAKIVVVRGDSEINIDLIEERGKYGNFILQDNDKIIVPLKYYQVYVRGEVFKPGPQPYLANYKASDYIGRAGALDSGADKSGIIVIRSKTGQILKGPDTIVEKGDTIILPKRNREIYKDYMTILSPVVSLLIATVALLRR